MGKYGSADPLGSKLVVQGDIAEGATITFYVNDEPTGQTAEWHSGEVNEFDLSVTIAAPGPAPGPTYYYIQTNLFGIEKSYRIDSDGEIQQTIEATSEDGMLTITIPKGTIALDKYGNRLKSLQASIDESPPDPPEDANIIGLAYDFGPDGATFDPGITFTWSYDPGALPEGMAEGDLVLAYYDEEWVELDCVVDTANNTITASVSHFTTFAIIAVLPPPPAPPPVPPPPVVPPVAPPVVPPPPVLPPTPPPVAPPVVPAPTPPAPVTAPPEVVPVAPVTPVAPPVAPPTPPLPAEVPPEPVTEVNWPLYGGIIAIVVIAVALIIFIIVRRRVEY